MTSETTPSIIKPTVGRVVHFWEGGDHHPLNLRPPRAAIIAFVHSDHMVNLAIFDALGQAKNVTSVNLYQPGETRPGPAAGFWCEWMQYQKDQAAKHATPEATPPASPFPPVPVEDEDEDRPIPGGYELNRINNGWLVKAGSWGEEERFYSTLEECLAWISDRARGQT